MDQAMEASTIQASVDMCGLVTQNREAEDALAENAMSCITEGDSLEAENLRERDSQQQQQQIPPSSDPSGIGEAEDTPVREDPDDQWALSSVASWFSSSVKDTTQAFDIPSSIIHTQASDEDPVQEIDENDDDEDDDASLMNQSLASLISSIGYISTGSRAPSRRQSLNSHPEARILQMPENLLDDISTGSMELVFADDDKSITPSLANMTTSVIPSIYSHQSLKDLLGDESSCVDRVAESQSDKDENGDDEQVVNASAEPSPHNIFLSSYEQDSKSLQQTIQQTETVSADDSNHSLSVKTDDVASLLPPPESLVYENDFVGQDGWASLQTTDQTETVSVDDESSNNCPLSVKTLPESPSSLVYENGPIGQDGWASDSSEKDFDIETPPCLDKPTKLDTSSDTTTTMHQSYDDEEDEELDGNILERAKTVGNMCKYYRRSSIFCCCILFIALGSLMSLWIVKNRESMPKSSAIFEEDASLSPSSSAAPSTAPSTSIIPPPIPSDLPSVVPSNLPSVVPSNLPSVVPSNLPSVVPSDLPSVGASSMPSASPNQKSSSKPSFAEWETIFYAIGDVPYNNIQKGQLRTHMKNLPSDGEFLIHVGDIRPVMAPMALCRREEYMQVRDILLESKIPVFILPGDNEWTDCGNLEEGQSFWMEAFQEFDKNWNHSFSVHRHPSRPENFHFVHKRTIFFGLNLVGGEILDRPSFAIQLKEQFEWVKEMLDKHVVEDDTLNVVIFGHALPRLVHQTFFGPLKKYITNVLKNDIPVMYLNGDYHYYDFEQNYMGLENMQRLQVDMGTTYPPLKVSVSVLDDSFGDSRWNETFSHDRMI